MKDNHRLPCHACWRALTYNLSKICVRCIKAGEAARPNPAHNHLTRTHSAGFHSIPTGTKIYRVIF